MKKLILFALSSALAYSAHSLPTYEPFTEYGNAIATSGSNLVVTAQGHPIGTNASAFVADAIDLSNGGLVAPSGESWTSLNFGGLNSSGTTNGADYGLDVGVVSNSAIFTASALSSILPSTFPGFPSGGAITNLAENPAQTAPLERDDVRGIGEHCREQPGAPVLARYNPSGERCADDLRVLFAFRGTTGAVGHRE